MTQSNGQGIEKASENVGSPGSEIVGGNAGIGIVKLNDGIAHALMDHLTERE